METLAATISLSADAEVFTVWDERSAGRAFVAESFDRAGLASVLWELDEQERETGRIAGVEIVGFRNFEAWDTVPDLPVHWQLPGQPPLPLTDLLQREQQQVRRHPVLA